MVTALPIASDAQRPVGADTLSEKSVAESLKVLSRVRKQVAKDRNNAALWYHRGMLAWALYDRDRTKDGLEMLDWTRLAREADSSIRLAAAIEPKNARYKITQGQYYIGSGWIPVRVQAYRVFDQAIARARESGDVRLIAEAAIEKGRVHWRRYDPSDFGYVPVSVREEARRLVSDSGRRDELLKHDVDSADTKDPITRESLRFAQRELLAEFRRDDGGFTHEADYTKAEEYFREAYNADPTYHRAYQQLAMVLAERARWSELASLARARITRDRPYPWAWMTLGLAMVRTGDERQARIAFDSGLARMSASERSRLDNIGRVLRPSDSAMVASWSDSARSSYERQFWNFSAPLWSREETHPRAEFLARVTFSELRWTVDELRKRGADSDRGMVFIRYGPPDSRLGGQGGETWWYDYARLTFHFTAAPTFGTAYFVDADWALDMMDSVPARWDNVVKQRVDSLPVRLARFRALGDSVDVVFSSLPPVTAIRAAASIDEPVRTDFWLFTSGTTVASHDTGATRAPGARAFTRRLADADYLYRFEASSDGSMRAASATSGFSTRPDTFAHSGFGMSDLLLASRVTPRAVARRWSEFDFDASAGSLAQGAEIALIWESYELAERNGNAEYSITLSLERKYQQFLNKVRARIISAWAAMMGSEQTSDRVVFHYDRSAAHAPVIADYVTLALEDTPPGNYDLTLIITDKVSGKSYSRTTRVVIRD